MGEDELIERILARFDELMTESLSLKRLLAEPTLRIEKLQKLLDKITPPEDEVEPIDLRSGDDR